MTDDITHYDAVEAYCGRLGYAPGDELTIHVLVACRPLRPRGCPRVPGAPRQLLHHITDLPGIDHPTRDTDAHGCVYGFSFKCY